MALQRLEVLRAAHCLLGPSEDYGYQASSVDLAPFGVPEDLVLSIIGQNVYMQRF